MCLTKNQYYITRRKRVLRLIRRIRESFDNSVEVYTEGQCVQFCMILLEVFPQGKIYYDVNHAIFKLGSHYYDITGEVEVGNHIPLEEYGLLKAFDLMNRTEDE